MVEYIATRPIFCNGVERMPGSSFSLMWWDKYHIREGGNGADKNGAEGEV